MLDYVKYCHECWVYERVSLCVCVVYIYMYKVYMYMLILCIYFFVFIFLCSNNWKGGLMPL